MATPAPDRVVADRYLLEVPLGRGGMGVVWRARDTVLGRSVAVKEVVLPPSLPPSERGSAQARVMREARAAARLNHRAAVTLYDVVRDQGHTFIVMELVEAPTLADVVRDEGPLPPRKVAEIGVQLAGALEAAHRAGIVHRDVKPGNVMVAEDGGVKLADFGIASVQGDPRLTTTGLVIGSPAYMAPEQARGEPSGPAADFWALGATLYAAVEGTPPFDKGASIPTLAAVVNEDPRPMHRAGPLAQVIAALLSKDPTHRPTGPEVRAQLQPLAGALSTATDVLPTTTAPLPVVPPTATPTPTPPTQPPAPTPSAEAESPAEREPAAQPLAEQTPAPAPTPAPAAAAPPTPAPGLAASPSPAAEAEPAAAHPEPEPAARPEPVAEAGVAAEPPGQSAPAAQAEPAAEPAPARPRASEPAAERELVPEPPAEPPPAAAAAEREGQAPPAPPDDEAPAARPEEQASAGEPDGQALAAEAGEEAPPAEPDGRAAAAGQGRPEWLRPAGAGGGAGAAGTALPAEDGVPGAGPPAGPKEPGELPEGVLLERPSGMRRGPLIGVVGALVIVVVLVAWLTGAFGSRREPGSPTATTAAAARPETTAQAPSTRAPSTKAPTTQAPTTTAAGQLPAGWTSFNRSGGAYAVGVPPGWRERTRGKYNATVVEDERGDRVFTVRSTNPANPLPDASRQYRDGYASNLPGYRQVRFDERGSYQGRPAVVFEYEFVDSGRRVHVRHVNLKARTWGYNVEFVTPAEQWQGSQELARQFELAFRPRG